MREIHLPSALWSDVDVFRRKFGLNTSAAVEQMILASLERANGDGA